MKSTKSIVGYTLLGIFSFLFFLYLTFPYEVLKEVVSLKASQATGMTVSLGDLGPSFPIGISAEDMEVSDPSGATIKLKECSLNLSLLNLFIGNLTLDVFLEDQKKGFLNSKVNFSVLGLITSGGEFVPSSVYVEARKFLFGSLIDFSLNMKAKDPKVNVLLKPLLESIDVDGKLTADVDLSIDEEDIDKSSGKATIQLDGAVVKSLNPNLSIPVQRFSKAFISADLKNGTLVLDPKSELISQDLNVKFSGKIIQKPQKSKSLLDLLIAVELGQPILNEFGFLIDALTGRSTGGRIKVKVSGTLVPSPTVTIL